MDIVNITDIQGIKLGHEQDYEGGTGCTAIICEAGATAGVDVRGGAPGTRETDLLDPRNLVEKVHAVMLSGGSAFGLDAACGAMEYLEEKGIGFDVGVAKVPIVVSAVLFDLSVGRSDIRPDKDMGYRACKNSEYQELREGCAGAGTGATIGKLPGMEYAMKGGFGTYCVKLGELYVGAALAVNCLGDVVDPKTGSIIAGALHSDGRTFMDSESIMLKQYNKQNDPFSGNTTIGAVITNGKLTKAQCNKVASMAHDGYGRTMSPAHTMFDGDTIFTLALGNVDSDISVIGMLAARTMEQAIIRAVKEAESMYGYKAYKDIHK